MSRDAKAGLVVLAASLVLFALTLDLKDSPLVPVGPGFYPRVVLALTALLALALIVSEFLAGRRAPAPGAAAAPAKDAPNHALVALCFGAFALYCVAMPGVGFRIATFAYVMGSNLLLAPQRGVRGWVVAALLGLGTTLGTWLVFEHYLSVLLPRGRWTDF